MRSNFPLTRLYCRVLNSVLLGRDTCELGGRLANPCSKPLLGTRSTYQKKKAHKRHHHDAPRAGPRPFSFQSICRAPVPFMIVLALLALARSNRAACYK